ncbi:MAG: M48 family metallopeptidase, partial [Proteobacteria bacterium]|nr:M48 family metallopeptidase [Pseudomonadota bacterium]
MSEFLDRVRFESEKNLLESLFDRYGLAAMLEHFEKSGEASPHYEFVMSTQMRLTPLLAPRLHRLLDEVCERLDFHEPTQLFVQASPEINAGALHSLADGTPHAVSLTSGLITTMDDDELRFVLGHEIGHLWYRHYRTMLLEIAIGADESGESRLPALLKRRLDTWGRLAELSADRSGHAAVAGQLDPIVAAFLKMASGLGPEYLSFDLEAYLQQLLDIQKMKRSEFLANFSHPITPVRVRALQIYAKGGGSEASDEEQKKMTEEISTLAELMEFEATEPLPIAARDFLLSAGLLAAHADGEPMDQDQQHLLVRMLLPLTADPEAAVANIQTQDEARKLLDTSVKWLRENAGSERYELYNAMARLCAMDGRLHHGEQEFMLSLAENLEIPAKAANQILYEVLAEYLQAQQAKGARNLGFQVPIPG